LAEVHHVTIMSENVLTHHSKIGHFSQFLWSPRLQKNLAEEGVIKQCYYWWL